MAVRAVSCLSTQSLTAMEVTTTVGSLIVLAQRIPKLLESPLAMARVPWYVPQTAGVSMEEWATGVEENQRTRMSLVDSQCHHLLHLRQQMLLPLRRQHHVSYYGIPCGSLMGSNTYTCRSRRVNTCIHTLPFQLKWGSACSYLRMAAISV